MTEVHLQFQTDAGDQRGGWRWVEVCLFFCHVRTRSVRRSGAIAA